MWSNQENRVRKQVKNPCEVRKIKASQILHKIISTRLLTVLTIRCITQIVNRKIEISKKTHDGPPSFDIDVQFGPQLNKREEEYMNIQKFTQKSVEAINDCEKLAYEYGNQEIEQEHLLVALLQQEDGLILKLIEKMEIQKEHFLDNAKKHLAARVKVSGGQVYVGQDLNKVLIHAEDEAKQMGDEYVSVEHLFLALLKYPNKAMKEIFKEYGITRDRFLQALSTVRGNQRVVSDNPEATYDTLEKYGYDMVARAKEQKLDPVIGRDDEIRNVVRILTGTGFAGQNG